MNQMSGSTAIGDMAFARDEGCHAWGDHVTAETPGEVVIGDKLFGVEIPPEVMDAIRERHEEMRWMARILVMRAYNQGHEDARKNMNREPSRG